MSYSVVFNANTKFSRIVDIGDDVFQSKTFVQVPALYPMKHIFIVLPYIFDQCEAVHLEAIEQNVCSDFLPPLLPLPHSLVFLQQEGSVCMLIPKTSFLVPFCPLRFSMHLLLYSLADENWRL
jgi:hypothetical protein